MTCRSEKGRSFCCPHICATRRSALSRAPSGSLSKTPAGQVRRTASEWFCFGCGALLHRVEIAVGDFEKDLPPLFAAFYADRSARTCESAGACIPEKRRCRDGRSFPTEGELRNSDFQKLQLRGPRSRGNRPRLLLQCVNAEPFSVFTRRLGSKAAAANASAAPFGMHDSALRI